MINNNNLMHKDAILRNDAKNSIEAYPTIPYTLNNN